MAEYDALDSNMLKIVSMVLNNDWDWNHLNDGPERTGKSNLAFLMLLKAHPKLKRFVLTGEYDKVLGLCAWTWPQAKALIATLKPGSIYLYHESSMLGRRASSKLSVDMVRVMTTMGNKNLFGIWTFPRKRMLDPYVRNERLRTWARVFTRNGQRGYAIFRYRDFNVEISTIDLDETGWVNAFVYQFPAISSLGKEYEELWERFRERERTAKDAIIIG